MDYKFYDMAYNFYDTAYKSYDMAYKYLETFLGHHSSPKNILCLVLFLRALFGVNMISGFD